MVKLEVASGVSDRFDRGVVWRARRGEEMKRKRTTKERKKDKKKRRKYIKRTIRYVWLLEKRTVDYSVGKSSEHVWRHDFNIKRCKNDNTQHTTQFFTLKNKYSIVKNYIGIYNNIKISYHKNWLNVNTHVMAKKQILNTMYVCGYQIRREEKERKWLKVLWSFCSHRSWESNWIKFISISICVYCEQ